MVLGDAVSTLEMCLYILNPCFKVYNLVSVSPKNIKLGQMTSLNVIFMWWCPFIDWLKLKLTPVPCSISEWAVSLTLGYFVPSDFCVANSSKCCCYGSTMLYSL